MNRTKFEIVVAILAIGYLIGAIANGGLNVSYWHPFGRVMVASVIVLAILVSLDED